MSNDYKLGKIETDTLKNILLASNAVLACLGVIHWGYCGSGSNVITSYQKVNPNSTIEIDTLIAMIRPVVAYYAICGIQQVIVSVIIFLFLLKIVGENNKRFWVKLVLIILMVDFGFNTAIAVSASLDATFYAQNFKYSMEADSNLPQLIKDYNSSVTTYYGYTVAEAVLTFVIALPLIAINFISFISPHLPSDDQTQIPPKSAIDLHRPNPNIA